MSVEEHAERDRCDEEDAALFVVAAFTGLRMGELLALRDDAARMTKVFDASVCAMPVREIEQ